MTQTTFGRRGGRVLAALCCAPLVIAAAAGRASAQALFAGSAGSGANTYYFDLDFRDFAVPQYYAFEYFADASTLTFADVLQGLTVVPTFSTRTHVDPSVGLSLDGIAFDGKTKYNDFAGNNSGEPNGYWSQWNSSDGGATWQSDQVGIGGQTVKPGQWVGASWTADYLTVTDAAPRVPLAAAAAAPEPGALPLTLIGILLGGHVLLLRAAGRWQRTAGGASV